jgi:hypothetical protein
MAMSHFYSSDGDEPLHVHVQREGSVAKFWLEPVRLERSGGFRPRELRRIESMILENHHILVDGWNDHFGE